MVGVLVISHGPLAEALLTAVQSIVGRIEKVYGISISPSDNQKGLKEKIQKKVKEVNDGDGVLILTDMLGGTPTNLSLLHLDQDNVEIVTGVNLPMLLTLLSYRKRQSLKEIGGLVKISGRRSIVRIKEFFHKRKKWG